GSLGLHHHGAGAHHGRGRGLHQPAEADGHRDQRGDDSHKTDSCHWQRLLIGCAEPNPADLDASRCPGCEMSTILYTSGHQSETASGIRPAAIWSTRMSVAKVTEIIASSPKGFDDAIASGIKRANKTLKHIRGAWVRDHEVVVNET